MREALWKSWSMQERKVCTGGVGAEGAGPGGGSGHQICHRSHWASLRQVTWQPTPHHTAKNCKVPASFGIQKSAHQILQAVQKTVC